jgi:hypothetical protein
MNKYTHYGRINIYDRNSGKKICTYKIRLRQTSKHWIDDFGRRYQKIRPNYGLRFLYCKHCSHIIELPIDNIRELEL